MPHMKDRDERWALRLLEQIIRRDREDRDALPGSVVKLIKKAIKILRKRQRSGYSGRLLGKRQTERENHSD
jgi:hypothetical protein